MSITIVEKEIEGMLWNIEWDGSRKVGTYSRSAFLFEITSTFSLTPEQAYDMAMLQLEWLIDRYEDGRL